MDIFERYVYEYEREFLIDKLKQRDDVISKVIDKLQFLIDIGFDYDGFEQADSLKTLIDELIEYARESRNILAKCIGKF